jgi:hypothetical protein
MVEKIVNFRIFFIKNCVSAVSFRLNLETVFYRSIVMN